MLWLLIQEREGWAVFFYCRNRKDPKAQQLLHNFWTNFPDKPEKGLVPTAVHSPYPPHLGKSLIQNPYPSIFYALMDCLRLFGQNFPSCYSLSSLCLEGYRTACRNFKKNRSLPDFEILWPGCLPGSYWKVLHTSSSPVFSLNMESARPFFEPWLQWWSLLRCMPWEIVSPCRTWCSTLRSILCWKIQIPTYKWWYRDGDLDDALALNE